MIGNGIHLEQQQRLNLTQELVQSLQLLQMNTQELLDYIEKELVENPVLEEVRRDDESGRDYKEEPVENQVYDNESDLDIYERSELRNARKSKGDFEGLDAAERYIKSDLSLGEYLLEQLRISKVSIDVAHVCEYLIGCLDSDGYLHIDESDVSGIEEGVLKEAIDLLQSMDPVGVGARTVGECLLLQMKNIGSHTALLERLVVDMLEDVAENRIARIASELKVTKREAQQMVDCVRSLEPRPGRGYSSGQNTSYITPDVLVETDGVDVVAMINDGMIPGLEINEYYKGLQTSGDADAELKLYLRDRFGSANRLINCIGQRNRTLLRITEAVIKRQKQFFDPKRRYLAPLTLQEIADELTIAVSTVSRAVNGKYVQINGSLYPLKYFFGSGVTAYIDYSEANDFDSIEEEGAMSAVSVKARIRVLIEEENKSKPLSDQKITDILNAEGIEISRRTTAKYRENLGIPGASKRRRF